MPSSLDSTPAAPALWNHLDDPVLLVDADSGAIQDVNEAACRRLSYPAATLTDCGVCDISQFPDYDAFAGAVLDGSTPSRARTALETGDDETIPVELTATRPDDDSAVLLAQERERAQAAWDETTAVLETVLANLPVGVLVEDPNRDILMINESLGKVLGVPLDPEAMVGRDCAAAAEEMKDLFVDPERFVSTNDACIAEREPVAGQLLSLADGRVVARDYIPYELPDGEANLWLYRDVTERVNYERQLEHQRDGLDVLNELLRHDIRNDLQMVTAYADFIAAAYDDPDGYTDRIHASVQSAVELTNNAREMAELLLGASDENFEVEIRDVVQTELESVGHAYDDAIITADHPLDDVTVVANDILQSLVRNLLTNAIQHNDKATAEVTVATTTTEGTVRIRVADNGPGVPDERKETVFGKGKKGTESNGTGLGLYFVRTFVESYNGDVWVEDNIPEGAVFVVELPLSG